LGSSDDSEEVKDLVPELGSDWYKDHCEVSDQKYLYELNRL
jgi:hypothetical protein